MDYGRPLPPAPTPFPPGSAEKVDVMMRRFWSGYQLHHPDDAGRGLPADVTGYAEAEADDFDLDDEAA